MLFNSWLGAVIFGIVVTFFVGVIASVVARVDVKKMNTKA